MQPRRTWASCSSRVTNAPRRSDAPGTRGKGGGANPASAASIAQRANASSAARSAAVNSGSAMVWLPTTNGVGAIELLVNDHPRQLVRQRQWTEAPDSLGAAENLLGQSVRVPDDECDIARIALPVRRELSELLRRP